jgi:hypothetical protein
MWIRKLLGIPSFKGHSPCAPKYEPDKWKDDAENNCYNYGCNIKTSTFARPGRGGNKPFPPRYNPANSAGGYNCDDVTESAKSDGLISVKCEDVCSQCCYKVALMIHLAVPNNPKSGDDYHWVRQDDNSRWSHKPGQLDDRDTDDDGNPIDDPEKTFKAGGFKGYNKFCGYFCVCKDKVKIG